jgi:isopentenyldiphosphate isomerase
MLENSDHASKKTVNEIIDEYLKEVDIIYGTYFDSMTGFNLVKKNITDIQKRLSTELGLSEEELDRLPFTYGKGNPDLPFSRELHSCAQGELKRRNESEELNYRTIANACLVFIYQLWDDHYRREIANLLGVKRESIISNILGDIRYFRHSIIHHRAIAIKDVEKCTLLKWFKEGDEIVINKQQFEELIDVLKEGLEELKREYCTK